MGTYEQGILGAFSGLVGPVVGSSFRGVNVMRGKPRKTAKAPTLKQLVQLAKFTAVTQFLTPAKSILSEYFAAPAGTRSCYNLATSYHLQEAVEFEEEAARIIYHKALFSKGALLAPQNLAAVAVEDGKLELSWDNNSYGNAQATDKLITVVYEPGAGFYEFFYDVAVRADRNAVVKLPAYLIGSKVHCWAFMAGAQNKLKSTSQYLGEMTVL